MLLEKTLESPLDCKKFKSDHLKGNQSWIFIGRTDAEAEAPILWPPNAESTHWKRPWCWARLRAKGEGGDRGWDGWMASLTSMDMSLSKLREIVKERETWHSAVHGVIKSQRWLSDWRTTLHLENRLETITFFLAILWNKQPVYIHNSFCLNKRIKTL